MELEFGFGGTQLLLKYLIYQRFQTSLDLLTLPLIAYNFGYGFQDSTNHLSTLAYLSC